jgi:hypothetical protein
MGASVLLAVAVLLSYAAIGVAAITSLNVSTILDFPGRVLSVGAASNPGTPSGGHAGSHPSSQTPTSGPVPNAGSGGSSGDGGGGGSSTLGFGGSGAPAGSQQYPGVTTPPSDAPGATGGTSTSSSNSSGGAPPPPKPPKDWFGSSN